jgi:rhodanese-related sulfurtransferase
MSKKYSDYVKEVAVNVKEISIERLTELDTATLVIVDIREESEYRGGIIPGAIMIPRGVLESKITETLKENKKSISSGIYLICRSGMRSTLAAESLLRMGFEEVYSVRGGMKEWGEKKLETIKP